MLAVQLYVSSFSSPFRLTYKSLLQAVLRWPVFVIVTWPCSQLSLTRMSNMHSLDQATPK